MHITPEGLFDPERFNAAYNAVILAKLTLLDPRELNRLVADHGVRGKTDYGDELYAARENFNILIDAIRSIDGNHQWNEFGPRYPRRVGVIDTRQPENRSYGYKKPKKGFRLWQDDEVRKKVFNVIFHGPNAPGIEAPSTLGLPEIVGNYDYKPSLKNPFPLIKK